MSDRQAYRAFPLTFLSSAAACCSNRWVSGLSRLREAMQRSLIAPSILLLSLTPIASAQPLGPAERAFDAGDYQKAIQLFEQSQKQEERCEVFFYIGVARFRLRQIDDAIISFQTAASCDPKLFEAHVALAEAYVQKGNDALALLSYEEALRLQPNDPGVMRVAGSLYLRHQLNDKALPLFQKLVARNADDAAIRADLGGLYGAIGDLSSAEEQFRKALDLQPNHPPALTGLANLQLKNGRPEEAVPLLEKAILLVPSAHEPHFLLGSAYNGMDRFEEAVQELTTAIQLGGSDPEIYYHLVRAYGRLGLSGERDKALAKFSELKKQSVEQQDRQRESAKLLEQARDLVLAGVLVGAGELVERSYALNPDNAEAIFRLAGIRYDLHQYDLARQNAERATQMAPSDWRPHYLLGLIEEARGNLLEAQTSLEVAARLNPAAAEVHNELGKIALARNDRAGALIHFQMAVDLAPANDRFRANLGDARRD